MVWKHIRDTFTDPSTWREVTKDLIKDAIKWLVRAIVVVVLGLWLGSKLDPTIALAWAKVTGAFGPVWQALWKPLGIPRVIALAALVAAVAPPLLRWWRLWRERKEPRKVVVEFVQAAPPAPSPTPPVSVFDLTEEQQRLLTKLWRIYDKSIDLNLLQSQFDMTYGAMERLVESVEAYGLVETIPGMYQRKSVVLTKKGRDLVHDSGLDLVES
jgi:DNA-binding MarR family transcriptional regulator